MRLNLSNIIKLLFSIIFLMSNILNAQHLKFASNVGFKMLIASMQCFFHAIVPSVFKNSGSKAIKELYNQINNRN